MRDVIAESGHLFIATRMKRLAERMQADAGKIFVASGFPDLNPSYNAALEALDKAGPASVGEIVGLLGISQPAVTRSLAGMKRDGLVKFGAAAGDQRQKIVSLSPKGRALVELLKRTAWRDITAAAEDLTRGLKAGSLDMVETLEQRLADKPLPDRIPKPPGVEIIGFEDRYAKDFHRLNAEWISTMFKLEKSDNEVLANPRREIIDRGGDVLFVRDSDGEIIGAGGVQPVDDEGEYELVKMVVSPKRRGQKAGEALLAALIQRARQLGARKLHLLTNKKCVAAIPLYEKLGFVHSDEVMRKFGAKYSRADVAMRYPM